MHSFSKKFLVLLAASALARSALAFSLLGPYLLTLPSNPNWQIPALGYQRSNDIGGPMFLNSFYRWNFSNVTYAYDQSFINYFGTNGIAAVDSAVAILNSMPPSSTLNINDFPLDSKLWNPVAEQAGLLDLKSHALHLLIEHMGLADPERFAWTIYYRAAAPAQTNYYVIQMNYDPDTFLPTGRVNSIYYTYRISEVNGNADAVEVPVTYNDHLPYSAVAGGHLDAGYLYTGVTRDDAAGLKFLLSTNTLAIEGLLTNQVFGGGPISLSGFGWIPYFGTTNVLTNATFASNLLGAIVGAVTNATNFVATGIRGGVNKVKFTRVEFDSLLGNTFTVPLTNYYTDLVIVTNKLISQKVHRVIAQPDIVFVADHLGFFNTVFPDGTLATTPNLMARTDTSTWVNDDTLNGRTTEGGPGLITGPIQITFTSDLGGLLNSNPYYWDEQWSTLGLRWASFDHTPKAPVIYPVSDGITIDQLLQMINTFTNYTPGTILSTQP
jgi:hypothetical protein